MDKPEEITFAWLLLIGISITFLLAMAVVLFVVFYQRRLYRQRMEMIALKANQKKAQLQAALAAQELERARIARDLHDEIGATLSTAKLLLSGLGNNRQELDTIKDLVTHSIGSLRSISHNLLPPTLEMFGLVKALDAHIDALHSDTQLAVDFNHKLPNRLAKEQEIQVYRIVQELLNNTLKHAKASLITIDLQQLAGKVSLRYSDNGSGFELSNFDESIGLGLRNLQNRSELLGGTCGLQASLGKGMQFELEFESQTPEP